MSSNNSLTLAKGLDSTESLEATTNMDHKMDSADIKRQLDNLARQLRTARREAIFANQQLAELKSAETKAPVSTSMATPRGNSATHPQAPPGYPPHPNKSHRTGGPFYPSHPSVMHNNNHTISHAPATLSATFPANTTPPHPTHADLFGANEHVHGTLMSAPTNTSVHNNSALPRARGQPLTPIFPTPTHFATPTTSDAGDVPPQDVISQHASKFMSGTRTTLDPRKMRSVDEFSRLSCIVALPLLSLDNHLAQKLIYLMRKWEQYLNWLTEPPYFFHLLKLRTDPSAGPLLQAFSNAPAAIDVEDYLHSTLESNGLCTLQDVHQYTFRNIQQRELEPFLQYFNRYCRAMSDANHRDGRTALKSFLFTVSQSTKLAIQQTFAGNPITVECTLRSLSDCQVMVSALDDIYRQTSAPRVTVPSRPSSTLTLLPHHVPTVTAQPSAVRPRPTARRAGLPQPAPVPGRDPEEKTPRSKCFIHQMNHSMEKCRVFKAALCEAHQHKHPALTCTEPCPSHPGQHPWARCPDFRTAYYKAARLARGKRDASSSAQTSTTLLASATDAHQQPSESKYDTWQPPAAQVSTPGHTEMTQYLDKEMALYTTHTPYPGAQQPSAPTSFAAPPAVNPYDPYACLDSVPAPSPHTATTLFTREISLAPSTAQQQPPTAPVHAPTPAQVPSTHVSERSAPTPEQTLPTTDIPADFEEQLPFHGPYGGLNPPREANRPGKHAIVFRQHAGFGTRASKPLRASSRSSALVHATTSGTAPPTCVPGRAQPPSF